MMRKVVGWITLIYSSRPNKHLGVFSFFLECGHRVQVKCKKPPKQMSCPFCGPLNVDELKLRF